MKPFDEPVMCAMSHKITPKPKSLCIEISFDYNNI